MLKDSIDFIFVVVVVVNDEEDLKFVNKFDFFAN